jgi:hypothetical protein
MFEKVKRMLNFDNVADQQQKQAEIERMLEERGKDAVELSDDPNDNVFSFDSSNPAITELTDVTATTDDDTTSTQTSTPEPVIDIYTSTEIVGWPDRQTQFYFYNNVQRYMPHNDSVLEFGAGRGDFNQWYETTYQTEREYLGYELRDELVQAGKVAYGDNIDIVSRDWMDMKKRHVMDWCVNIGANNYASDKENSDVDSVQYLKDTIDQMMSHCRKGSVIMFQSNEYNNLPEGFVSFNVGDITSWAIDKYKTLALDHSAGDGQCYLVIYKTV